MKKELADSLREMQAHPTTGTAHNQQLISTQVEAVFALDSLQEEIEKLRATIESSNKSSEKLEHSNYRLQVVMLVLTAMSTGAVVFPIFQLILGWLISSFSRFGSTVELPLAIISTTLSVFVAVATFFTEKKVIKSLFEKS